MVTQMIAVGEDAGSARHDARQDRRLLRRRGARDDRVAPPRLIEPLLIAFIGVVIGGMIVALYLPDVQHLPGDRLSPDWGCGNGVIPPLRDYGAGDRNRLLSPGASSLGGHPSTLTRIGWELQKMIAALHTSLAA